MTRFINKICQSVIAHYMWSNFPGLLWRQRLFFMIQRGRRSQTRAWPLPKAERLWLLLLQQRRGCYIFQFSHCMEQLRRLMSAGSSCSRQRLERLSGVCFPMKHRWWPIPEERDDFHPTYDAMSCGIIHTEAGPSGSRFELLADSTCKQSPDRRAR